jgi:mono/diheme cytochrome c family protein
LITEKLYHLHGRRLTVRGRLRQGQRGKQEKKGMNRRWVALVFLCSVMMVSAIAARQAAQPQAKPGGGWTLPPEADTTKNPLTVDAKLLATGKAIFKDKCQKCHGASGKGDGPDADPDAQEDMDLTRADRAAKNSEGVMFYKVFNGRKKPKMPAQKDELTKDQIWSVVAYAQTLRKPAK